MVSSNCFVAPEPDHSESGIPPVMFCSPQYQFLQGTTRTVDRPTDRSSQPAWMYPILVKYTLSTFSVAVNTNPKIFPFFHTHQPNFRAVKIRAAHRHRFCIRRSCLRGARPSTHSSLASGGTIVSSKPCRINIGFWTFFASVMGEPLR